MGAKQHSAWANSLHVQDQAENPDDQFKGVTRDQVLTNDRWCYIGSFSDETLEQIQNHPDVSLQLDNVAFDVSLTSRARLKMFRHLMDFCGHE